MRSLFWLFLCCLLVHPLLAQAGEAFKQTQLDAIFLVGEDSVTALYSFSYVRPPDLNEIRWVFPISPDATRIALGPANTLPLLQYKSDPNLEPPGPPCHLNPTLVYYDGYGDPYFVQYLPAVEATVTRMDLLAEALGWLGDGPQDTAALSRYDFFVAISITPDPSPAPNDWQDSVNLSPLLVVEYPGQEIFLPTHARASAFRTLIDDEREADMMPVTAYIFADQPYAPTNFETVLVDLTTIERQFNAIRSINQAFTSPISLPGSFVSVYYNRVYQALDAVNGRGMVTDYRQAPTFNLTDYQREVLPDETTLLDSLGRSLRHAYPLANLHP